MPTDPKDRRTKDDSQAGRLMAGFFVGFILIVLAVVLVRILFS